MELEDIDLRELAAQMDHKALAKDLEMFGKSAKAYHTMRGNLLASHPEEWVVVYDGKVLGFAKAWSKLLAKLEKAGIPKNHAYIGYLHKDDRKWYL